jgi:uncharacterized protein YbjQ (UPF0145 family)
MDNQLLITTSTSLEGYKVKKQLGLVQGITVRSRSVFGSFAGSFLTIFGGQNSIYTELCETTRKEALDLMIKNAKAAGANGVVNMRYDANEIMAGVTEVLAYGTGVVIEKID